MLRDLAGFYSWCFGRFRRLRFFILGLSGRYGYAGLYVMVVRN